MTGDTCKGTVPPLYPIPPDPGPIEIPIREPDPLAPDCGTAYWSVEHLDSALDYVGTLWNKYKVSPSHFENCSGRPQWPDGGGYGSRCYWESNKGVVWVPCSGIGFPFPTYIARENCNPGLGPVTYKVSAGCTWNEAEGRYDTVYEAPVDGTDNGVLGLAWHLDVAL